MDKVVKERFRQIALALKLQAKEYKRRLKDLNGESGRIRNVLDHSIPREIHQLDIKRLDDKIDILTTWKNKVEGKNQWQLYVPWVLTVAAIAVAIFKH